MLGCVILNLQERESLIIENVLPGTHRSLGVHISKVRSLDLDSWNDNQLYALVQGGNDASKAYWEARKPSGLVVGPG